MYIGVGYSPHMGKYFYGKLGIDEGLWIGIYAGGYMPGVYTYTYILLSISYILYPISLSIYPIFISLYPMHISISYIYISHAYMYCYSSIHA